MKKGPSKEIKRMLIGICIITFLIMLGTFVLSIYLLTQVWDNEALKIMVFFIVAQLVGFIIFIIILAYYLGYYEYNEYWAYSMWGRLLKIGTKLEKIQEKLNTD